MTDVFFSDALLNNISATTLSCFAVIKATPSLIIPDFSFAISSILLPSISIWSIEIGVITVRLGLITFVESNLPPNPVSIMATSTLCSLKWFKAIAVVTSKNVESILFIAESILLIKNIISSSLIGAPLILIRSLNFIKCGEVYSPTL